MQKFRYKALSKDGETRTGELAADTEEKCVALLRSQGMTVLKVEVLEAPAVQAPRPKAEAPVPPGRPSTISISRKELTVLTRQLATTLKAGLPLLRILSVLHSECQNPRLRLVFEKLGSTVQKGARFSDALREHPQCFDEMYVSLVRVGEMSGGLPECTDRMALMLEKEMTLRRKLGTALAYPFFILAFTALMTYGLVAFLMPMFTPMFVDAKLDIPRDYPLTHFLMQASAFASSTTNMLLLGSGLLAAFAGGKAILRVRAWRRTFDNFLLRLPFVSSLVVKVVAARFSRNFSLLLKSGVSVIQAMDLVAGASGNVAVEGRLRTISKSLKEGDSISRALKQSGIFPDLLIQMAIMGEEAGSLAEMLERVADYFDEEVDTSVATVMAVMEPMMMVVVGGVVGVFVMGVLLPILGVSTGYQNQM